MRAWTIKNFTGVGSKASPAYDRQIGMKQGTANLAVVHGKDWEAGE